MECRIDFLECLETDMVLNVLKCLDDPADLVRVSIVSRNWRDFVVDNKLSKLLCVGRFPQLANVVDVAEFNCKKTVSPDVGCSRPMDREVLTSDHKAFASLLHTLTKLIPSPTECIKEAFSASSTDNYPDESVAHTLDPRDRFARRASYWSSKGQKDPSVPETLVYKLKSEFCVVTEIDIQPFEAFFQMGFPIYSAKSVRFRIGHPKCINEVENFEHISLEGPADDMFRWTYTSPEFPMAQENRLQHFKFPEPVLCMGGFLQIELLGRVQRQEMDGLFYICIAHVKVLGRPLSPAFNVEVLEPSGKFMLKYFPEFLRQTINSGDDREEGPPSYLLASEEMLWGHAGLLEYVVGGVLEEEEDDDDDAGDWAEEHDMDEFLL